MPEPKIPLRHTLPRRFWRGLNVRGHWLTGELTMRQRWIAQQSIIRFERNRVVTVAWEKALSVLEKPW